MRRLFILLTVCTLILAGCSGQSKQTITENQSMETTSQVEETETTEIVEAEGTDTSEVESTEENVPTEAGESKEEPEPTSEPEAPVSTEAPTPAPTEPEQSKEEPTEAPTEVEAVAYDPYEVVSLATAKTKAYGKISIPEDLVLFGKLSAPTFFTLNAPVFRMVWINIQNPFIRLCSLFKVSLQQYCINNSSQFPFSGTHGICLAWEKEKSSELSVQFKILTNRRLIRIAHLPGAIQENRAFPVLWNPLFSSADTELSVAC